MNKVKEFLVNELDTLKASSIYRLYGWSMFIILAEEKLSEAYIMDLLDRFENEVGIECSITIFEANSVQAQIVETNSDYIQIYEKDGGWILEDE